MKFDAKTTPALVLDTRGLMCPEPIRLAEGASRRLDQGDLIEVLATDRAAPIDFEAWSVGKGHEYLGARNCESWLVIRVRIRRHKATA